MTPTCSNCKFFMKMDEGQGFCRRFPPFPHLAGHGQIMSQFTTCRISDWCGEYILGLTVAQAIPEGIKQ